MVLQVRIHCYLGSVVKARNIVDQTQNPAGAHYLAMQCVTSISKKKTQKDGKTLLLSGK